MRRTRLNNKKYMNNKAKVLVSASPENPEPSENTTFFITQWVTPEVGKMLQKSSIMNPEFNVHYSEKEWHEDGDLVQIRLTFRNCGRNLYQQRLFTFLIRTFHKIN